MAALVFAPQLGGMLNSAIGGIQVSAAVAPTAFTMGLPAVTLAQTIGATGVAMISGAVQNAVTSGLMGGDIGKAALSGAISPALAGNANKILENVGIGQDSIAKIAAATNLSAQQVTNLMANGLTVGVTGAVLGDPNALENALTSTAGQFAGYEAQNLVYDTLKSADPKVLAATANAAGNVANIATQTTINGGDVSLALQNAMPSIITDAAQAGNAVKPNTPAPVEERSTTATTDNTAAQQQVIDEFGKPLSSGVGTQLGDPTAGLTGGIIPDKSTASDVPINLPQVNWTPAAQGDGTLPSVVVTADKTLSGAQQSELLDDLKKAAITGDTETLKNVTEIGGITPPDVTPPIVNTNIENPFFPVNFTPEQKVNDLQKQADTAKTAAMDAAAKYLQTPTPATKAVADKAVLDAEIAQKSADSAKSDLSTTPTTQVNVPLTPVTPPTNVPSNIPSNVPSNVASENTATTTPPTVPSTISGSGTSNLPSNTTSTTSGLGGAGTVAGTGAEVGTGTGAGAGTGSGAGAGAGSGSGSGTGTGTGTGADLMGILSALAGGLGGGKVPTVAGGLSQVPAGYTAVTTPLAKRPIGDLYPVSNMMMSPEEITARSTTKMVRRGGLVSIR
jgi:hypothetical protein